MSNGRLGLRTRPGTIFSYTQASVGDPDANAFISAAGLTNDTQKNAINQLVIDLKFYSLWTKLKVIYPFVGGTAATHRWNLRDPRSVNDAFYLEFFGGWTHSDNGIQANGTTGYADTKFIPSTNLSANNQSASFYSRTNASFGVGVNEDLSVITDDAQFTLIADLNGFSIDGFTRFGLTRDVRVSSNRADGFFVGTRTSSTNLQLFRQKTLLGTTTASETNIANMNVYLSAANNKNTSVINYTNRQYCFATMGDGLTQAECDNLFDVVQAFQTTLGRQV